MQIASLPRTGVQHRTRQIEARYYYITDKVKRKIKVDMFTKALPRDTIHRHSKALRLEYPTSQHICTVCETEFSSNNLLHKHLREKHSYNKGETLRKPVY